MCSSHICFFGISKICLRVSIFYTLKIHVKSKCSCAFQTHVTQESAVSPPSSAAEHMHKCLYLKGTGSAASVSSVRDAGLLHPVASGTFTPHATVGSVKCGFEWSLIFPPLYTNTHFLKNMYYM